MLFRRLVLAALAILLLAPAFAPALPAAAAGECVTGAHYFPETKKCVSPLFYTYWQEHGGLAQQGLPVTDEFPEISTVDGKAYTVQYFERARFEYHPENKPPYNVLLGLLGAEQVKAKYAGGTPARGGGCQAGEQLFAQTQHCVPPLFYTYWQEHGGLAQQGLPLSDPFMETNPTNGKQYLTQYFERARFEAHPENQAPYDVLLGLLGAEQVKAKYPDVIPVAQDPLSGADGPFGTYRDDKTVVDFPNGALHVGVRAAKAGTMGANSWTEDNQAGAVNVYGLNDMRVEMDVTKTAGADDGYFGVVCRFNGEFSDSTDTWYGFFIDFAGRYWIVRHAGPNDKDSTFLVGTGGEKSAAIKTGNATNHVQADCKGDVLALSVNGQQVAQVRDKAPLKGAGYGYAVYTYAGTSLDLTLKNFRLGILP